MSARRNFGLDLARALAISMVFLAHGVSFLEPLGVGVDLFFVLSGFLIGRIFLRGQADAAMGSGTFTVMSFWSARWMRTLPPYLVALALYAVAHPFSHLDAVHPYYLGFLQNYLGMDGFGPSWSLSVEEHFYLALPLVGFGVIRLLGRRSLLWVLPMLGLVPLAFRVVLTMHHALPVNWYWRTHLHCEGMIFGVWLAYLFVDRQAVWRRLRPVAFAFSALPLVLLGYQLRHPAQPATFQAVVFLLYALGYTGWVRCLYDLRWSPRHVPGRCLQAMLHGMALASYSIYLLHTLLFTDIRLMIDGWARGPIKTGAIMFGTIAACILFYFAVERPTIVLRDRILNRKKQRLTAPLLQQELEAAQG